MDSFPRRFKFAGRLSRQTKTFVLVLLSLLLLLVVYRAHLNSSLAQAVKEGDVVLVHSLLDSGASPNAHLPRPWDYSWQDLTDNLSEEDYANGLKSPTLVLAAAAGNLNIVKLLLDRGAAVDATDLNGNTALMMASSTGNLQCVKLLLHKGANPNAQTTQKWGGMTPLMFAAHRGNAQVVLELINRGANVNLGDNDGFTPLMRAASESQVEVAKTLLSHGANVNARDNRLGRTPLMAAVFPGCGYGERQPDGEVVVAVGR